MAQVNLYNPPNDFPQPGGYDIGYSTPGGISTPGTPGGREGGTDVSALYRNILGRDPDATELSSDTENLGKYGAAQLESNLRQRASSNGGGAQPKVQGIGPLFDDPASNQLQGIAQAQMGELRDNPALNELMAFLGSEFNRLSTTPGFTPEEQAALHTQALEPIEQRRQASNQRAVQRAAASGFLPTSGITYLNDAPSGGVESLDTSYDRMRTTADRDLALAGQQQRRADLNQALQIGQLRGLDIPKSQRAEELNLSQLIYQLPRNALSDLMQVLNGSASSNDAFSQALNIANQNRLTQQENDARNAALMQQIGQILAGLF